jgi:hypothetical protein
MTDDQATVTLTHRVTVAKYEGDRTPADGEPDDVIELEWIEEQEDSNGFDHGRP